MNGPSRGCLYERRMGWRCSVFFPCSLGLPHLWRPEIPITPGSVSHVDFCIASRLWSSTGFSLLHSIDGGIEQWEVVGSRCSVRDGLRDASSDCCFVQRHRGRAWMLFAVGLSLGREDLLKTKLTSTGVDPKMVLTELLTTRNSIFNIISPFLCLNYILMHSVSSVTIKLRARQLKK